MNKEESIPYYSCKPVWRGWERVKEYYLNSVKHQIKEPEGDYVEPFERLVTIKRHEPTFKQIVHHFKQTQQMHAAGFRGFSSFQVFSWDDGEWTLAFKGWYGGEDKAMVDIVEYLKTMMEGEEKVHDEVVEKLVTATITSWRPMKNTRYYHRLNII